MHDLAAGSAWRMRLLSRSIDQHCDQGLRVCAARYRCIDCIAFGALGQTKGSILDVAPAIDLASFSNHRGPYPEFAVR